MARVHSLLLTKEMAPDGQVRQDDKGDIGDLLRPDDIVNGTYRILKEIGEGGMGVIYLAWHLNLNKYVVIKKIKDDFVGRMDVRAEADIMKNLSHSYLPQIYDFVQIGTDVYTVMSYIDGCDFSKYIKAGYRFTEEQLTQWLTECLEVLDYLHTRPSPILHMDIKPGNIMLDTEGHVSLIDFNISFHQCDGANVLAASKAYASPEQLHPRTIIQPDGSTAYRADVDVRTDIYSLGATFYHLTTGIKPDETILSVYPITGMDYGYSEPFVKIIEKAMQPTPADRYQSAAEMLADVKTIYKRTAGYRRMRALVVTGAVVFGVLVGCAGVLIYRNASKNKRKTFEQTYRTVIAMSAETDAEETLGMSVSMLENEDYSDYYDDNPDMKGMLLYQAGKASYTQENYTQAATYFEEALDYIDEEGCVRDYVAALIKAGLRTEAEQALATYEERLDEFDQLQIRAQCAIEDGAYEEAAGYLEYAAKHTTNADTKTRCIFLACEVYEKQGNYEAVIDALKDITVSASYETERKLLLADAYIAIGNTEADPKESYDMARTYLEELRAEDDLTLSGAVNLVVVYMNSDRTEEAETYLAELEAEYPNDYRVMVQRCFLDYKTETKKEETQQSYAQFAKDYEAAMDAYEDQTAGGIGDTNADSLKQLYRQLVDKGYL